MRRLIRDNFLRLAKGDIISFLEENEDELLQVFREEMSSLDHRLPEEQLFIDIRMAPLGEELLRAVLATIKRFLREY
ncbi:MAG: hypothetical protein MUP04_09455 [Anaerolineae bacterium]|jgi:hypothetical protein|nr:hypothetical protein [Anaerolineae bacterium]